LNYNRDDMNDIPRTLYILWKLGCHTCSLRRGDFSSKIHRCSHRKICKIGQVIESGLWATYGVAIAGCLKSGIRTRGFSWIRAQQLRLVGLSVVSLLSHGKSCNSLPTSVRRHIGPYLP
jgi:hypothetical protein